MNLGKTIWCTLWTWWMHVHGNIKFTYIQSMQALKFCKVLSGNHRKCTQLYRHDCVVHWIRIPWNDKSLACFRYIKNKYLPAASATSAPTTAPILLSSKVDILYQRETRIWKNPWPLRVFDNVLMIDPVWVKI